VNVSDRPKESMPLRALLVDDDPVLRILAREALEQSGLLVDEAENGAQALSTYEQTRPDIILMDVMMPVMDGFEACRRLRTRRAHVDRDILDRPLSALGEPVSVERRRTARPAQASEGQRQRRAPRRTHRNPRARRPADS